MMQMCSKCRRRVAVVYITKLENNNQIQEGLCLQCAKSLGIKPVEDLLDKMGISEEALDSVSEDMTAMMDIAASESENAEEGGAPAIELPKLFQNLGMQLGGGHARKKQSNDEKSQKPSSKRKFLDTYCQDLTKKAAEGKVDRIIGRDRELDRVIQILCRRQKNNPCLIGEPGVGKTAIAEALAVRIVENKVPQKLADKEIHLLDLTALVAGTQFRGQFESRVLGLLNEVREAGNVILVIDEVHNIVGAGDSEGSMNAANMLKPALSRGEIQVIGATTLKEYRKHIEKDSALERRFQSVMVNEPSVDETAEMLKAIKGYYESFHGVVIPDNVLYSAAYLSERYITDRFLPDKAIDLLDEAAARLALETPAISEMSQKKKSLKALIDKKATLESKQKPNADEEEKAAFYRALADLRVEELQLNERITALEEICANVKLTEGHIAGVIEIWTGIPATDITSSEFEQLDQLADRLKAKVIGQDEAVDTVVRAIKRKRAGISYRKSPVSMIFAGPTGVGKTELVKVLAADLFKQPDTLIRLDMSEFMEKHAVSRIIGAPPGYVGYDEAGQLTEKIRRKPYSVVLFDEIEKAHPDVLNILLQVLDDGHITDAAGRRVNFENTVIIMTTNAGSDKTLRVSGFSESEKAEAEERTQKALLTFLRPEFVNRVDSIVTFRHLSKQDCLKIAELMLQQMKDIMKRKDISLEWSEEVLAQIVASSYSQKFGAREMRRFIEKNIENQIAEQMMTTRKDRLSHIALVCEEGKIISCTL